MLFFYAVKLKAKKLARRWFIFDNRHNCENIGLAEIVNILDLMQFDIPVWFFPGFLVNF